MPASLVAPTVLRSGDVDYAVYSLEDLARHAGVQLDTLPITIKILLENLARREDGRVVTADHVMALARWDPTAPGDVEVPFLPYRVVMQDFTGVPAVVDLAAMRSAVARAGGDPGQVNPLAPVDLVIDHSVQVDSFGTTLAFRQNVEREYERNGERYALLRWAQGAFDNFRVVPPGTGIVHQVNLEYLASVVASRSVDGRLVAFPDTLVGTDSHTTMINGLGVLGWGVGGIEAEAAMLGQPMYLLMPTVVGLVLTGQLREGVTATDLVLTITQLLRKHGVVEKFVEFAGPGLSQLPLADRATIANMCPEYGATAALFPVDEETLSYLRLTGRPPALLNLVERYTKHQGLFRSDGSPEPRFSERLHLDLGTVEPSLAGPRRPQDRVSLSHVKMDFREAFARRFGDGGTGTHVPVRIGRETLEVGDGSVAIAAITSCTNTSNPAVMLAAGLVAKRAVERGLRVPPTVKTSMAPGSQVVTEYLRVAGLLPYLEALRFHTVGYGCTTCIGNSGPLVEPVEAAIRQHDLVVAAVLSGNRNFEGRIHPSVRASYLASPPLVVAYALAGTVDIDLTTDPIGEDANGTPVYLKDIWPSNQEVAEAVRHAVSPDQFERIYGEVFTGDSRWRGLPVPAGDLFAWNPLSTYIQEPPFFLDLKPRPEPLTDIVGARALAVLGSSITTDHISPAGAIPVHSPAGQYLIEQGVDPRDFNSYGARRGNDRVMVRGTFGNVRLRNELVDGREGDWTVHLPDGEVMRIYDAAQRYRTAGVPLVVIAGQEYGSGSSRDWAAKGVLLLGVRAVLAESFERIHRSNLVGMGVAPLLFKPGQSRHSLGLTGREVFDIRGLARELSPRKTLEVTAHQEGGPLLRFDVTLAIDSLVELDYYRHGGVLQLMLRDMLAKSLPREAASA